MPEFYEDPMFKGSQEKLFPFYSGILEGDVPDYYKPIGESGGKEFEDILGLTQRDVTRGVTEDFARRKVRGARGGDIIGRIMGDITKKMRWEDYSRAIKGRESLLGVGTKGLEGVRGAGLQIGGQKNQFNVWQAEMEAQKKAEENKMWANIIESVIGGGVTTLLSAYGGGGTPASNINTQRGSAKGGGVNFGVAGSNYGGGYGGGGATKTPSVYEFTGY